MKRLVRCPQSLLRATRSSVTQQIEILLTFVSAHTHTDTQIHSPAPAGTHTHMRNSPENLFLSCQSTACISTTSHNTHRCTISQGLLTSFAKPTFCITLKAPFSGAPTIIFDTHLQFLHNKFNQSIPLLLL